MLILIKSFSKHLGKLTNLQYSFKILFNNFFINFKIQFKNFCIIVSINKFILPQLGPPKIKTWLRPWNKTIGSRYGAGGLSLIIKQLLKVYFN